MPGAPPTTPKLGLPRFSNADESNFAAQVNSVVDELDDAVPAIDDDRLVDFPIQGIEGTMMLHGKVSSLGVPLRGEGYTVIKGGAGVYSLNFGAAFSGIPDLTATPQTVSDATVSITGESESVISLAFFRNVSNAYANTDFTFIVVGPR